MSITLERAHASGWEGDEAVAFVAWYKKVESAFETRFDIPLEDAFGDWRSADYFRDFGDDIEAVIEQLAEDAREEHPGFEELFS